MEELRMEDSCSPEKEVSEELPAEKASATVEGSSNPEEAAFAFLLALMPLVALTFFGQAGLI